MTEIMSIKKSTGCLTPLLLENSSFGNLKPREMDLVCILLAEINKKSDVIENTEYYITSETISLILDNTLHYVTNMLNSVKFQNERLLYELESGEEIRWFDSINYKDGVVYFKLTSEMKHIIIDEIQNPDNFKIYCQLRYMIPLKSVKSKILYLMCRQFKKSGYRFCDNDWNRFKTCIGVPDSYSYQQIRTLVLDKSMAEISEKTDITTQYDIAEANIQGGTQPLQIRFTIRGKDVKDEREDPKDLLKDAQVITRKMNNDEKEKLIKQLQEELKMKTDNKE